MEDEDEKNRVGKIFIVTVISASIGFLVASSIFTNDDIFKGARSKNDLKKIWREYARLNHPDKSSSGNIEEYIKLQKRYKQLESELPDE